MIPGRTPARVSGSFNTEKRQQKIGITQQQQNNNNPNKDRPKLDVVGGGGNQMVVVGGNETILCIAMLFKGNFHKKRRTFVKRHNPFTKQGHFGFFLYISVVY